MEPKKESRNESRTERKKEARGIIAAVRIKGIINLSADVKDTLSALRLHRQNFCSIAENTPCIKGMLKKVERYITWGEIDEPTFKILKEKKEEQIKTKDGKTAAKPFYRLNPPKKGFGRKGIKIPFRLGGAYGYRGEKINDLIRRMLG